MRGYTSKIKNDSQFQYWKKREITHLTYPHKSYLSFDVDQFQKDYRKKYLLRCILQYLYLYIEEGENLYENFTNVVI